jgi:hypothetical protein
VLSLRALPPQPPLRPPPVRKPAHRKASLTWMTTRTTNSCRRLCARRCVAPLALALVAAGLMSPSGSDSIVASPIVALPQEYATQEWATEYRDCLGLDSQSPEELAGVDSQPSSNDLKAALSGAQRPLRMSGGARQPRGSCSESCSKSRALRVVLPRACSEGRAAPEAGGDLDCPLTWHHWMMTSVMP